MEFSASQVHETESEVGDQVECRVGIDGRPLQRRVVDERDIAAPIGAQPVEHGRQNLRAEWVVEVDNQVTAREFEGCCVGVHQANVAAGEFAPVTCAVVFCHLDECRRDLDPDDLAERAPGGMQHHPAQARADIHERRAFRRQRNGVEQPVDVRDRRGLVVGRKFEVGADGLGVEFAEKDQRLGRDAVLGIEAPACLAAQWTSELASVNSTPSAAAVGATTRTAARVAARG